MVNRNFKPFLVKNNNGKICSNRKNVAVDLVGFILSYLDIGI